MHDESGSCDCFASTIVSPDRDGAIIRNLSDRGFFVVVGKSAPDNVAGLVLHFDGTTGVFQTEDDAHAFIQDIPVGNRAMVFEIVPPSMEVVCWQGAVAAFIAENWDMDPEDVRERCLVDCDELMERHARGVPPALAAAEYCAGRWDFDFDTWRERHMPSLETVSEQHGCISP